LRVEVFLLIVRDGEAQLFWCFLNFLLIFHHILKPRYILECSKLRSRGFKPFSVPNVSDLARHLQRGVRISRNFGEDGRLQFYWGLIPLFLFLVIIET
jgi:hypothetical protein